MQRKITGFYLDEEGDWVARLDCHHGQHVRHHPPFINRPWVVTFEGRNTMVGTSLDCVKCDRLELPVNLELLQRMDECDETTLPQELRLGYATKAGIWSRICVLEGRLTCALRGPLERSFELVSAEAGIVPPEVVHVVTPSVKVRFVIEFLVASSGVATADE